MLEFRVFVDDRPGELARVTEVLAGRAVNIRAIASEGSSPKPFLRIVTTDVNTTRKALKEGGFRFEESEILDVRLPDRPGELAKIARRLARAGINVSSIYLLETRDGRTHLALTVSDPARARELVGEAPET